MESSFPEDNCAFCASVPTSEREEEPSAAECRIPTFADCLLYVVFSTAVTDRLPDCFSVVVSTDLIGFLPVITGRLSLLLLTCLALGCSCPPLSSSLLESTRLCGGVSSSLDDASADNCWGSDGCGRPRSAHRLDQGLAGGCAPSRSIAEYPGLWTLLGGLHRA